ncbi:hypothetical protein, partial [Vulcanococcus limneticus]|uniref:hypothetical protein n=1 Tax=Vulcanococcus limneticus TaxID=2170428 RepID=UPI001E2D896A
NLAVTGRFAHILPAEAAQIHCGAEDLVFLRRPSINPSRTNEHGISLACSIECPFWNNSTFSFYPPPTSDNVVVPSFNKRIAPRDIAVVPAPYGFTWFIPIINKANACYWLATIIIADSIGTKERYGSSLSA